MRKLQLIIVLAAGLFLGGCGLFATVGQGHEGVAVRKPIIFGHGGVKATPILPGRIWKALTTSIVLVDMRPKQFSEQFEDMVSSDNVPVSFSAYVILKVRERQSPLLVSRFGDNLDIAYANNIKEHFRTLIRREAQKHSMTALTTGAENARTRRVSMDEIADIVLPTLEISIEESGIPVDVVRVVVSKAVPKAEVLTAIAETAAQQQRQKTEKERAAAEVARKEAETRRAEADDAYRTRLGLTPEVFAMLKSVEICSAAENCTVVFGVPTTFPVKR